MIRVAKNMKALKAFYGSLPRACRMAVEAMVVALLLWGTYCFLTNIKPSDWLAFGIGIGFSFVSLLGESNTSDTRWRIYGLAGIAIGAAFLGPYFLGDAETNKDIPITEMNLIGVCLLVPGVISVVIGFVQHLVAERKRLIRFERERLADNLAKQAALATDRAVEREATSESLKGAARSLCSSVGTLGGFATSIAFAVASRFG